MTVTLSLFPTTINLMLIPEACAGGREGVWVRKLHGSRPLVVEWWSEERPARWVPWEVKKFRLKTMSDHREWGGGGLNVRAPLQPGSHLRNNC